MKVNYQTTLIVVAMVLGIAAGYVCNSLISPEAAREAAGYFRAIAYEKSGRWFTAEEPLLRAKERTDAGSSAFRHPRSELIAPLPQEVEPAFNNRKLHMRLPCVMLDANCVPLS